MATRVQTVDDICLAARDAARELAAIDGATRAAALLAMADAIDANAGQILAANERDMEAGREEGLSAALMDRLALDPPAWRASPPTCAPSPACPIPSARPWTATGCPTAWTCSACACRWAWSRWSTRRGRT